MRRFNYTGPVYEDEHYVVKREQLYIDFKSKADEGRYFTIFAPRQMGKTTFLKDVIRRINQDNHHIAINLDFERYRGIEREEFYLLLKKDLTRAITKRIREIKCEDRERIEEYINKTDITSHISYYEFIEKLGRLLPDKRIVILIDEFDAVPIKITETFLYTLRDIYLKRKEEEAFSIYSIGLVGVKNIRELNFGSTSPFNIATQIKIENFTKEECYELINQYIEETGHGFEDRVIDKIHYETSGHPFLVNRLCAILVEDIVKDKTKTITMTEMETGLSTLLKEHNSNFDTLKNNAERYEETVRHILFAFKEIGYLPHNRDQEKLIMYGIIKEDDGNCEISSPIYKWSYLTQGIRSSGSLKRIR